MLEKLKKEVCEANKLLSASGLAILTWGNASGIDRERGLAVIKPSGVPYDKLEPGHMAVVELLSGKQAEGMLKPSTDTPAHLELYRAFQNIGGVVHTHSTFATAWAQALKAIPVLGTTHADTFSGPVPCTRPMTEAETRSGYEAATGRLIIETLSGIHPLQMPAILVASHGPFVWGDSPAKAVENSIILEEIARMAFITHLLGKTDNIPDHLLNKHFLRKHGDNAYYGQSEH